MHTQFPWVFSLCLNFFPQVINLFMWWIWIGPWFSNGTSLSYWVLYNTTSKKKMKIKIKRERVREREEQATKRIAILIITIREGEDMLMNLPKNKDLSWKLLGVILARKREPTNQDFLFLAKDLIITLTLFTMSLMFIQLLPYLFIFIIGQILFHKYFFSW